MDLLPVSKPKNRKAQPHSTIQAVKYNKEGDDVGYVRISSFSENAESGLQKAITDLAAKLEPEFWDSAFAADKDCAKKMVDGGMQLITPSAAMIADLRKKSDHLVADFMKKVPSSQAPIKAYLAEVKRA